MLAALDCDTQPRESRSFVSRCPTPDFRRGKRKRRVQNRSWSLSHLRLRPFFKMYSPRTPVARHAAILNCSPVVARSACYSPDVGVFNSISRRRLFCLSAASYFLPSHSTVPAAVSSQTSKPRCTHHTTFNLSPLFLPLHPHPHPHPRSPPHSIPASLFPLLCISLSTLYTLLALFLASPLAFFLAHRFCTSRPGRVCFALVQHLLSAQLSFARRTCQHPSPS